MRTTSDTNEAQKFVDRVIDFEFITCTNPYGPVARVMAFAKSVGYTITAADTIWNVYTFKAPVTIQLNDDTELHTGDIVLLERDEYIDGYVCKAEVKVIDQTHLQLEYTSGSRTVFHIQEFRDWLLRSGLTLTKEETQ